MTGFSEGGPGGQRHRTVSGKPRGSRSQLGPVPLHRLDGACLRPLTKPGLCGPVMGVTDCLPGMYWAGPLPSQHSPGLLSEGPPLPQAPVHCHGATAACCTTLTLSTSFLPKRRCTAHGSALRFFTGQRKSKACSTRVCIKASSYLLMGGTIPLYQQAIIYLSSSAGKDMLFSLHYY